VSAFVDDAFKQALAASAILGSDDDPLVVVLACPVVGDAFLRASEAKAEGVPFSENDRGTDTLEAHGY